MCSTGDLLQTNHHRCRLHNDFFHFLCSCLDHTPELKHWVEAMRLDPAVKATVNDAQTYKGFLELYLKNSHEACDYGL